MTEIETKSVREGTHIGDIVWICHYHRPDLGKKPLRNIPPTRVVIRSNDELPKGKRIYYSETHFSPINKVGEVLKKVISPVDNTGYRSRPGNELFIFTTEDECNESWNSQIDTCELKVDIKIATVDEYWKNEKTKLRYAKK